MIDIVSSRYLLPGRLVGFPTVAIQTFELSFGPETDQQGCDHVDADRDKSRA
ncbi:MAG: hypothetical protein R3E89_02795 [Thiolinea sp.]